MDYKILYIDGIKDEKCQEYIKNTLKNIEGITDVVFCKKFVEVYIEKDIEDNILKSEVEKCGQYNVSAIH